MIKVAVSPDSKWVASVCLNNMLQLWDITTGTDVCSLKIPSDIQQMKFTADSKYRGPQYKDVSIPCSSWSGVVSYMTKTWGPQYKDVSVPCSSLSGVVGYTTKTWGPQFKDVSVPCSSWSGVVSYTTI